MSLDQVPLTLRIGDTHYTKWVESIEFQETAIGGVQYITFTISRDLDPVDGTLPKVYVYDARTGNTVAEGRLMDSGHTINTQDGNVRKITAFGPAQSADDVSNAFIYVDDSVQDGWADVDLTVQGGYNSYASMQPNSSTEGSRVGILIGVPNGTPLATNAQRGSRYYRIWDAGQWIARVSCSIDCGLTSTSWRAQLVTRLNGSATGEGASTSSPWTFSTSVQSVNKVVVTDFPSVSRNTVDVRFIYTGTAFTTSSDTGWCQFSDMRIRSQLKNQDGTDITTGYTADTVYSWEVVKDLLGRAMPQFDGANASVDTTGTFAITKLAYPDPVTPSQILDDLMTLDPAYRWVGGPSQGTSDDYSFTWEAWPTQVRYQMSLEDGGDFPLSYQDVYNKAIVRYTSSSGRQVTVTRTKASPALNSVAMVRQAYIDLGSEVGSAANATQVGDNFLADHVIPPNAGTVTINRPIYDCLNMVWVQPYEIAAGELIRIVGPDVDVTTDSLNASTNDGQSVFRIWTKTYNSENNSATCELDTYTRTTANALNQLLKKRKRT